MTSDVLGKKSLASMAFTLSWQSPLAHHQERYLGRVVNMWRDMFPPGLAEELLGKGAGESASVSYIPGKIVPGLRPRKIKTVPRRQFMPRLAAGPVTPCPGRYYPSDVMKGITVRSSDVGFAFRVLELEGSDITLDYNHPLADKPLTLAAEILEVGISLSGKRLRDWVEEITTAGPGMQARRAGIPTDFLGCEELVREDDEDDALFYAEPQLTGYVDRRASAFLGDEYARHIPPGSRVLDLMSSAHSHLPVEVDAQVTGLGLSAQEMAANPRLAEYTVHDLNRDPVLPFDSGYFDVVLCSLSVEYLARPDEVFAQISRVLRSGGVVLVGFSNHWLQSKAVRIWTQLHDFERLGYVLELLEGSGFSDKWTLSVRNWMRPEDDPEYRNTWDSDPVFVAGGVKP